VSQPGAGPGGVCRSDDPGDFCLSSAQRSLTASAERRAGRISRHLIPKLNVRGNSGGHPSSASSPAPCPLGRLPGAEAAAPAAEVRARRWLFARPAALTAARSAPASLRAPSGAARSGRFLDSARRGTAAAAVRVPERPPRHRAASPASARIAPGEAGEGAEATSAAGMRPLAHLCTRGWPPGPWEPSGALGCGTRFYRVLPSRGPRAARGLR
jgi:hypothetical protein